MGNSKKIISKVIIAMVLVIIGILSCQKEVEVIDNFDFKLVDNFKENGFIYEPADLTLSIIQDRVIKSNKYYFAFELLQGEGVFQKNDGTIINSQQEEKVRIKRNETLQYLPKEIGEHHIKVTISDLYKNIEVREYTFNVDFAPFSFLYTQGTNLYPVNQKSPTNLTYLQDDQEKFNFEYYVSDGTGTLFEEDEELEQNTAIEMNVGSHVLHYLPETLGEHKIHVKATADDGGERETELLINVTDVSYNLECTPQGQTVNLDIDLPITISLTTDDESGEVTYKIKYEYLNDSNTGTIKDQEGQEKAPGELWDIEPGNYEFLYRSQQEGNAEIKFTAVDSNEQEKDDTVIFNVENVSFLFTGSTVTNDNYINNITGLNFTLTPNGATENITYTIAYNQTEGNGVVYNAIDDTVIAPNTDLEVQAGAFSFNFLPQSLGAHKLNFTVTDNFGQSNNVIIELTAIHIPVTFVVTATNTVIVGQSTNVNFVITPQVDTDTTYQMNYILTGGEGELKNDSDAVVTTGNYNDVDTGSFIYNYTPSIPGNHELRFQLKDSNNQVIEKTVTIVVTNNTFEFTATAEDESILVNNITNINCNLNVTTTGNTNYYLTMTKNGANSNLSLNGTNLTAGVEQEITPGPFVLLHEPLEVGTTNYTLTMRDDLDNEVVRNVSITAGQLDFSLNVTQPQTIFINQDNEFTFALVPSGTYDGITYQMSYDVQNPQLGTFDSHTEAVPFDVVPVSFNMQYHPTTLGIHNVEFTVTDSNGQTHDYTETFEVVAADFTWVVNQSNENLLYNTYDNINAVLSQVITNDNITYSLSYTITGGAAQLVDSSNQPVNQGTITPGSYNYKFIASQTGNYVVNLIVTDSNNVNHNATLNYHVVHTDFEMYCSNLNNMFINNEQEFQINLTQNQDDSNINYEVKFNVVNSSTGDGNITDTNDNNISGWQPIDTGVSDYKFTATLAGGVELLTEIREQGVNSTIKSCTTTFNVVDVNTSFTCNTQNGDTMILDEFKNIIFNLSENPVTTANYEMKYNIINSTGVLRNGTNVLSPNTYFSIIKQSDFALSYEATSVGNTTINWTVKNLSTEELYTCSSNIVVNDYPQCDFSISGGAITNTANTNDNVPVNFLFNEIGDNCTTNYKFSFTTTGNGANTFIYNGQTISQNQEVDYDPSVNFGNYNGVSAGSHTITFNFRNTYSTPNTHSFSTNVTFEATDFTWNVTQSNQDVMINESDNITAVLTQSQTNPNITYTLNYTISNGQLLNASNQPVVNGAITPGNYNYHFISNAVGTSVIVLTVTDSNNISHSVTLNYTVNHTDFNVYCSSLADMYINQEQDFNTNIVQDDNDPNINYEIKYSISGSGSGQVLDMNDTVLNGWNYLTSLGVQDAKFKALTDGDVNLLVEVRETGNNATIKSCSSDFTINPFDVTFTGSAQNNTIDIDQSTNINFNITENPSVGNNYTMSYTYVSGSGLLALYDGGTELSTSTDIPVSLGQNVWNFKGTTTGNVKIHFILKNSSTGETYTLADDIEITVNDTPFCTPTIVANGLSSSAYIGESVDINLNLGTEETTTCQGNYDLYFTLPNGLNGEVTMNGVTKSPNQHFTGVTLDFTTVQYKGLNEGNHVVTFHLVNTENNDEVTQNVSILYNHCGLDISGSSSQTDANVNQYVRVNFVLDELGNNCNATYKFRFTGGEGNGNLFSYNRERYNINQWIDYVPSIDFGSYKGVNDGTHNITFEFQNTYVNPSIDDFTVQINYIHTDFTLECIGGGTNVELSVGDFRNFTNVIEQDTANSSIKYEFQYNFINGSTGIIKDDNDNILQQNVWLSQTAAGTYARTFVATDPGNIKIETKVRETGDNTTIKSCITQFTVIDENCDYIFDYASESNGQAPVDTLQTITIGTRDQSTNCNTAYTMYFTTTRTSDGATSDGHLVYNGTTKQQNEVFPITLGTFPVEYTTDVPGEYEIKFYINNPHASNATQYRTATIDFINPSITINLVSQDNNIYVLDDATYNFNVTGGSGNYNVSVNPNTNNSAADNLRINNTPKNWGAIKNTGNTIELKLTPRQLAQGDSYTMSVHDIDNDIDNTYTFSLNSNEPVFTLQNVYLTSNNIWSDETTQMHVEVNTNGYNHVIDYTYEFGVVGQVLSSNIITEGPPSAQNLTISPNGNVGNLQAIVRVTNEFSSTPVEQIVNFTSNDIMFNFNSMNISKSDTNINYTNYLHETDGETKFYNDLNISPNITLGKYNIANVEMNLTWYTKGGAYNTYNTENNTSINSYNDTKFQGLGVSGTYDSYGNNHRYEDDDYDIEYIYKNWSSDNNSIRIYLFRNLDYIYTGQIPVLNIKVYDTENNMIEHSFTLNNGWGNYNAD